MLLVSTWPLTLPQVPDMIDIVVSDPLDEEDAVRPSSFFPRLFGSHVACLRAVSSQEGKKLHTTFLITTHTNLPEYKASTFSVRRRYSDFECKQGGGGGSVCKGWMTNMVLVCVLSYGQICVRIWSRK